MLSFPFSCFFGPGSPKASKIRPNLSQAVGARFLFFCFLFLGADFPSQRPLPQTWALVTFGWTILVVNNSGICPTAREPPSGTLPESLKAAPNYPERADVWAETRCWLGKNWAVDRKWASMLLNIQEFPLNVTRWAGAVTYDSWLTLRAWGAWIHPASTSNSFTRILGSTWPCKGERFQGHAENPRAQGQKGVGGLADSSCAEVPGDLSVAVVPSSFEPYEILWKVAKSELAPRLIKPWEWNHNASYGICVGGIESETVGCLISVVPFRGFRHQPQPESSHGLHRFTFQSLMDPKPNQKDWRLKVLCCHTKTGLRTSFWCGIRHGLTGCFAWRLLYQLVSS